MYRIFGSATAEEIAYKFEKMAILKSRFFEALNVLEAATAREDVDNFFTIIDDGVFAIKRKLPALPARTVTTRAKRPSGERKAKPRPLKQKQQKKEGAAPMSMQRRARAASSSGDILFHYSAAAAAIAKPAYPTIALSEPLTFCAGLGFK